MAGVSSIGATAGAIQFNAELSARVAALQKDAIDQRGDLALQLIQSAAVDTGQSIDIRI